MPAVSSHWVIVGAGRCGLQLARSLAAAGLPPAAVAVRNPGRSASVRHVLPGVPTTSARGLPPADGLLIAVQDDLLRECAAEIASSVPRGVRVALHTSGLLPGAVLGALGERGVAVGSFHPMQTFPSPFGPLVQLRGVLATVEGDAAAVRAGLALARRLGMRGRPIASEDKPRYHAAAVIAANLAHVLVVEGRTTLQAIGFSRRAAADALTPLVAASLSAALASRGLEALSGPLARGDAHSLRAHLGCLDAPAAHAYRAVARLAVARFGRQGPPKPVRDRVLRALTANNACGSVPADD